MIVQVKKIDESIEFINSKPNPLVIYAFTEDETFKKRILSETSSGTVTFNDSMVQVLGTDFSLYNYYKVKQNKWLFLTCKKYFAVYLWYATIWRSWSKWVWKVPWEIFIWYLQPWESCVAQRLLSWTGTKVSTMDKFQAQFHQIGLQLRLLRTNPPHVGVEEVS